MQILLTSHGHLASGIKSSFEFIAGKSSHLMTIELDQDGIGSFQTRLKKLLEPKTEPILILADLKGGTPYNEAFKLYLMRPQTIRVVSGLNLPMLLELVPQLTEQLTLDKAVSIALNAGKAGIDVAHDEPDDDELEF